MDILDSFESLNVWKKGGERAPHKPLLVLYAIGRYLNGSNRLLDYSKVDQDLRKLLMDFGPVRKSYHPELPFWHLQSDGVWELSGMPIEPSTIGSTSAKRKLFLEEHIKGGFPLELYELVKTDLNTTLQIVESLLNGHFPSSVHDDILSAVGIDIRGVFTRKIPRDPQFRPHILQAYEYKCAICGFSSRLEDILIGIEAAHIKWHQAGGPDIVPNGIAMCSLHHKLFDRGLMSLDDSLRILVSEKAHGEGPFQQLVLGYVGKNLRLPQRPDYYPKDDYRIWHLKQVFQGPERYVG